MTKETCVFKYSRHVEPETTQNWVEAFAVFHNSRQAYRDLVDQTYHVLTDRTCSGAAA